MKKVLVLALVSALIAACSSASVDSDPTADMSPQQKRIWASP